jgi:beta-glucosidase
MTPPYKDASLSIDERVNHLISVMSIEEKVAQIGGIWANAVIDTISQEFIKAQAQKAIPHGIGHIARIGAVSMLPPQRSAELANRIQAFLVNETRLGIPAIVHEESCAGYLAKEATSFPQAIGLAATWEPELIEAMTIAIRKQMRAVGAHHSLAPVLDVARDPRWGRLEETFGEDPFLISALGVAYINGLQGDNWAEGIIATAKHFVGYGLPEGGMNWAPSHIPERMLREIYIAPFAAAIKTAKVASVMNGYQEIDGIPCGSSVELMVDLLRGELGFNGTVVADYFTLNMFVEYHHIAKNKREAAKFGLMAGIDIELPAADCYAEPLVEAVHTGEISIELVDTSVRRVLKQKIQLGLLENPYVDTGSVLEVYNTAEQVDLSRELAAKSLVLLKNDKQVLPLSKSLKRIAVIGPSANNPRLMQGDYHYPSHLEGLVIMNEHMAAPIPGKEKRIINWEEHRPPTTSVLAGIRKLVTADAEVSYVQGCEITGTDKSKFPDAIAAATNADIAIVVVGDISGLGIGATTGEAIDRATLELAGVQQDLILAIAETKTPTVVVALNGRPPVLTEIVDKVDAILLGWLPAQEGGTAIAQVLFGDVNPGGRLPVSLPRHVGQVPVYYNHKPSGGRSHWYGDYADMSTKPLFPFGFGLSYTQFEYSDLKVSAEAVTAESVLDVQVTVKNTGVYAGDEVVQLYLADPVASVTRPVKMLKGFKRIHLQSQEAAVLSFQVDIRHLGFYDRAMNYVVEPGKILVMLGSSSEAICASTEIEIVGETTTVTAVYDTKVNVRILA